MKKIYITCGFIAPKGTTPSTLSNKDTILLTPGFELGTHYSSELNLRHNLYPVTCTYFCWKILPEQRMACTVLHNSAVHL